MKGTKVKSNKGITLVALVITIIILLILAVVAINAVSGDGIIGKAKEAGSSYNEKATAENTELARQLGLIEDALGIEKVAEGEIITESNGKAARIEGLVYIITDEENKTAMVVGDRGNIDYTIPGISSMLQSTTSGNIVIASKVKISGEIYTVTSIGGYGFYSMGSATNLTNVVIPNSVTSIEGRAFAGCANLSSITIPDSVTSIGDSAFSNCTGLSSITIPNSVASIGNSAFNGCTSLNNITIPNSVTSIDGSTFVNCTNLSSITIPDSVTSIGMSAFSGCTSLNNITIPNSVTSIEDSAFCNCTNLSSITIPDSVTSIGNIAFSNCTGLSSITIPSSVTTIGMAAFGKWTSSQTINVYWNKSEGKPDNWHENWKGDSIMYSSNAIVHCPDGDITE